MNGQAITKRYEVRDADTGEAVTGAYVMVPQEDSFAQTCMFAYASLCGLDEDLRRIVAMSADPSTPEGRELLAGVAEKVKLPESSEYPPCESVDADQFAHQSTIGHGDGSVEAAYNLWRSLGYEPVSVVLRAVPKNVREAAEGYLDALADAADAVQSVEARRRDLARARGEKPQPEVLATLPDGRGGTVGVVKT